MEPSSLPNALQRQLLKMLWRMMLNVFKINLCEWLNPQEVGGGWKLENGQILHIIHIIQLFFSNYPHYPTFFPAYSPLSTFFVFVFVLKFLRTVDRWRMNLNSGDAGGRGDEVRCFIEGMTWRDQVKDTACMHPSADQQIINRSTSSHSPSC